MKMFPNPNDMLKDFDNRSMLVTVLTVADPRSETITRVHAMIDLAAGMIEDPEKAASYGGILGGLVMALSQLDGATDLIDQLRENIAEAARADGQPE